MVSAERPLEATRVLVGPFEQPANAVKQPSCLSNNAAS